MERQEMNVTGSEDTAALLRISIRADCNGRTPNIDLKHAQQSSLKESSQQLESNLGVLESGYLKSKLFPLYLTQWHNQGAGSISKKENLEIVFF